MVIYNLTLHLFLTIIRRNEALKVEGKNFSLYYKTNITIENTSSLIQCRVRGTHLSPTNVPSRPWF